MIRGSCCQTTGKDVSRIAIDQSSTRICQRWNGFTVNLGLRIGCDIQAVRHHSQFGRVTSIVCCTCHIPRGSDVCIGSRCKSTPCVISIIIRNVTRAK